MSMSRRIIITGGTGFIGRALCSRLVQAGHDVVALSRNRERADKILGGGVTVIEWDGESDRGWEEHANDAHAIINLAGESISSGRWTRAKKKQILQSRLNAGSAVLEAVQKARNKPRVVIQSSGIGYYGSRGDETVDESSSSGKGFLPKVAREWEESTRGVERLGVRHVIIRTGIVLGTDGGALPRLLTPFRLFVGGPLGSGRQGFPWIHIADEIEAIYFLVENKNLRGAFNLAAPEQISMQQFCGVLGKVMGRPSWLRVPGFLLRLLYGQMADEVLLSGQKAMPQRLLAAGYRFRYPEAESALRQILS
jgi:uncharacterized protein (TIGR01777 family)